MSYHWEEKTPLERALNEQLERIKRKMREHRDTEGKYRLEEDAEARALERQQGTLDHKLSLDEICLDRGTKKFERREDRYKDDCAALVKRVEAFTKRKEARLKAAADTLAKLEAEQTKIETHLAREKEAGRQARKAERDEQERQQALRRSRWDHPTWEQDKPEVDPADEVMLTLTQVAGIFKERLGVSRATFYRLYRPMLTVYFLGSDQVDDGYTVEASSTGEVCALFRQRRRWGTKRAKKSDVEALIEYLTHIPSGKISGVANSHS